MSDDAQIARLTELAQKVFEARRFGRVMVLTDGGVDVVTEAGGLLAGIATHPRALDALEAALLVMAGEPRKAGGPHMLVHEAMWTQTQERIAELELQLRKAHEAACESGRTMEQRVDKIQELLSGKPGVGRG